MPTYIYRCQNCEKEFEIIQSIKDDPISKCPSECSGVVKKVFSGVGISFKGAGFYKNDHGANSKKEPSSNTSTTTENKTSDSSSDTKNSASNKASESNKKETKPSKGSSSSAS